MPDQTRWIRKIHGPARRKAGLFHSNSTAPPCPRRGGRADNHSRTKGPPRRRSTPKFFHPQPARLLYVPSTEHSGGRTCAVSRARLCSDSTPFVRFRGGSVRSAALLAARCPNRAHLMSDAAP